MYASDPQRPQRDPVSLKELRNITPSVGLGLLQKGWLGFRQRISRSSLPTITTVNSQCLNKSIIVWLNKTKTNLLLSQYSSQYSSMKQGEGRGAYQGDALQSSRTRLNLPFLFKLAIWVDRVQFYTCSLAWFVYYLAKTIAWGVS